MEIGCALAPGTATPEHIATAEHLGYAYAYVLDSPAIYADGWMTLARAAGGTTTIRLGICALTPRLRHLTANAGAAATLAALAPGRVDVVVGAGFTSAALIGRKPARWVEVEQYLSAMRALLAGAEIEWEGTRIALIRPPGTGLAPVTDVRLFAAAHGPKGLAVATRVADGIVTNPGHGSEPIQFDGHCAMTVFGTVLDDGEDLSSPRVVAAAGPGAALALHLGDLGPLADSEEVRGYQAWLGTIAPELRHIELHRGHLIDVTASERPFLTPRVIGAATMTGTPTQLRDQLARLQRSGATSVVYQPAGPDIGRELRAFAAAATG